MIKFNTNNRKSAVESYVSKVIEDTKSDTQWLMDKAKVNEFKCTFQHSNNLKKIKKDSHFPYSIIADQNGNLYSIYNKQNENNFIVKGAQGKLKLARNIETGELCLVKIFKSQQDKSDLAAQKGFKNEVKYLKIKNHLYGHQEKTSDHTTYYAFIKLLPGLTIIDPTGGEGNSLIKFVDDFSAKEKAIILQNILLELQKLSEEHIVHRDLSGANILVDPITFETNIIDYGLTMDADSDGYCYSQFGLEDKGEYHRYANGYDISNLGGFLQFFLTEKKLLDIYSQLINKAGSYQDGYNHVDLKGALEEVSEYIKNCQASVKHQS